MSELLHRLQTELDSAEADGFDPADRLSPSRKHRMCAGPGVRRAAAAFYDDFPAKTAVAYVQLVYGRQVAATRGRLILPARGVNVRVGVEVHR